MYKNILFFFFAVFPTQGTKVKSLSRPTPSSLMRVPASEHIKRTWREKPWPVSFTKESCLLIRSVVQWPRRSVDMAKFVLAICCFLFLQIVHSLASEGKCIKGRYHKPSPSPETSGYKACHAFKESSCCTANFTVELEANEARNLYNHSWHRCGQLSQKCQQYWVMQVSLCADLLETSYPPGNHMYII